MLMTARIGQALIKRDPKGLEPRLDLKLSRVRLADAMAESGDIAVGYKNSGAAGR